MVLENPSFLINMPRCIAFILRNITANSNRSGQLANDIIELLISLFQDVLKKSEDHLIQINLDNIYKVLLNLTKSSLEPAKVCAGELVAKLMLFQPLDSSVPLIIMTFCEIFQGFVTSNNFNMLCILSRVALEATNFNYLPPIEKVRSWIKYKCFNYIREEIDPTTLYHFTVMLLEIYNEPIKNESLISKVSEQLIAYLHFIVGNIGTKELRINLSKLLAYLLSDFWNRLSLPWNFTAVRLLDGISKLPKKIKKWPASKLDVFYIITYFEALHSRVTWSRKSTALSIVVKLLKSTSLKPALLKTLILLFPITLDWNSKILSRVNELLTLQLASCKDLDKVLTYHPGQLHWILSINCDDTLKVEVLKHFINSGIDEGIVVNVFCAMKSIDILITIILKYPDLPETIRVVNILKKLRNKRFTTHIGKCLQDTYNAKSLGYLLQSKPRVGSNIQNNLILCRAMPLMMQKLVDIESFVCACQFSIDLLVVLKDEPEAFYNFTENTISVSKFFRAAVHSNEKLACSAIALVGTIILLQIRHKLDAKVVANCNMETILKGSNEKLSLGIDFLDLVLTNNNHRHLIFQLSTDKSLTELYIFLHQINNPAFTKKSYRCILLLLNIQNQLASLPINMVLIVSKFRQLEKTKSRCVYFLIFIKYWLLNVFLCNSCDKKIVYRIHLFLSTQESCSLIREIREILLLKNCSK